MYEASDTELRRRVALKVLTRQSPSSLLNEARSVAQLEHPHICRLYEVGHEQGIDYIVMEYLEGDTLASRLLEQPLSMRDILRFAIEIADALGEAHRHGIVHRDLKPGNIIVTDAGIKLIDFGLARFRHAVLSAPADLADTPTVRAPAAMDDDVAGTFQYMAPERLEGGPDDSRADVFSLGVVLYEMTTGRSPFTAATTAGVIAAVMKSDVPPMRDARPDVPAMFEWVVQGCLAKRPRDRWQSATDIASVLRWIEQAAVIPSAPNYRRWWPAWLAAAGAVILLAMAASGVRRAESPPASLPSTVVFGIGPPPNAQFTPTASPSQTRQFALSRDGTRLAFVAAEFGRPPMVWIRHLANAEAQPVAGSEGASYPFWSPDGRYVAFFAGRQLKRTQPGTGAIDVLCDARNGRGGAWNAGGTIVFAAAADDVLFRVPATGGTPTPVTRLNADRKEISHRWPSFLADGDHFLYFAQSDGDTGGIYLGSLSRPDVNRHIAQSGAAAVAANNDYAMFLKGSSLVAQRVDVNGGSLAGEAIVIAQRVAASGNFYGAFSASQSNVLAYEQFNVPITRLVWFGRAGQELGEAAPPDTYGHARLSPDGDRLAVSRLDPESSRADVWVIDLASGAPARLTSDPASDASPVWSRDAERLAIRSDRKGFYDLYETGPDRPDVARPILVSRDSKYATDWSPDGHDVIFHMFRPATGWDILAAPVSSARAVRPVVQSRFNEFHGALSPDGQWIAYSSDESSVPQVYVAGIGATSVRRRISISGGAHPAWRRDGRELFFVAADGTLMAVPVRTTSSFAAGQPVPLFKVPPQAIVPPFESTAYAVRGLGEQFLVPVPQQSRSGPLTVVVDWLARARQGDVP